MATIKTQIMEKTGADTYDVVHPETAADQVVETADKKVMTAAERTKLGGIAAGAQVNKIEKIKVNGTDVVIAADKSVNVVIPSNYITTDQKGVANGVASLDGAGKVPTAQLPSYVDDVLEYANLAGFPGAGEAGKIYVAKDTNKTYRWSGTAYVEISASLALGETASTAYAGDKGKLNRDDIDDILDGTKSAGKAKEVTEKINGKNIADIFEYNGETVKHATSAMHSNTANDAAESIGGIPISEIFESNGITVKEAHKIPSDGLLDTMLLGEIFTIGSNGHLASTVKKAETATKLKTPRTISISGDATGSAAFDGSADKAIAVTLANTGVTAGSYSALTVDAKGRVTKGAQVIEFGAPGQTTPSASLAVGGLFFKRV